MAELPLSRPREQKSDYIGTETAWELAGTLRAEAQPISDGATAEMYGVKIMRSVTLLCENSADIRERDRFEYRGGTYEVKGTTCYGNIIKAVAELV